MFLSQIKTATLLAQGLPDFLRRQGFVAEPDAAVTVDLQIKQPRCDKRPIGERTFRPGGLNRRDAIAARLDAHRLAVFVTPAADS